MKRLSQNHVLIAATGHNAEFQYPCENENDRFSAINCWPYYKHWEIIIVVIKEMISGELRLGWWWSLHLVF